MLKDYITTDPGEEAHSRKFLDTSTTSYSEITKGGQRNKKYYEVERSVARLC